MVKSKDAPLVLKAIKPYLARAEELSRVGTPQAATVAYYCQKYAMEEGLKRKDGSPEVKKYLLDLMGELEAAKKSGNVVMDESDAKTMVEEVAMAAFKRADDVDRAGNADKKTAMTYYAAQALFEVLRQFSAERDLDPDIKNLSRYAKFKAADIIKALNEGRKPTPGDGSVGMGMGMDGGGGEGGDDEGHEAAHDESHGSFDHMAPSPAAKLPPPASSFAPPAPAAPA